jgi:hypothetical protein
MQRNSFADEIKPPAAWCRLHAVRLDLHEGTILTELHSGRN